MSNEWTWRVVSQSPGVMELSCINSAGVTSRHWYFTDDPPELVETPGYFDKALDLKGRFISELLQEESGA